MGLFSFIGSLIGGNAQANASREAAQLQYQSTQDGIAESKRQFDLTRSDYAPYQDLGHDAVAPLGNIVGVNGTTAQNKAIAGLRTGPLYKRLMQSGGNAITANASATGGLRGGNTQLALAQNGEDVLNTVIANQLAQYSGLVGIGSGATGAVANFGANAVTEQNGLRNQGAEAQAQSALVRGGITAQNWKNAGDQADNILSAIF